MKSRSTFIVLALFLGGVGIHRFYMNRPGSGFLYLMFCWTLIPTVFGFIEAIMALTMSDEKFHQKFGINEGAKSDAVSMENQMLKMQLEIERLKSNQNKDKAG